MVASLVIGPLAKAGFALLAAVLLKPRTEDAGELPALDTAPLDDLASPASDTTPSTSSTSVTTDGTQAYLSPAEIERLLGPASSSLDPLAGTSASDRARLDELALLERAAGVAPSTPATSSTPSTSSTSVPVDTAPASVPASWVPVPAEQEPALNADDDSAREAARQLRAYIVSTTPARRDRTRIRALQAAMGGITVDGLVGRETARRIFDLTGLRIPGIAI